MVLHIKYLKCSKNFYKFVKYDTYIALSVLTIFSIILFNALQFHVYKGI